MTQKQLFQLPIGAGLYTEESERGAVGMWYKADKVRFRKGLPEKIGGWDQLPPMFLGTCRRLKDWSSLDGKRWAAIATDTKLYLWQDGVTYDITPLRDEGVLVAPFTTENSPSLNVTVNDANHGTAAGDYVSFSNTIVGASSGILVSGEYQVQSVIDIDNYTIAVTSAATGPGAAGEGGTDVAYEYQISAGASSAIVATGYGTGPYGREGYGNARTGSTLVLSIRLWSLDTWGEDLLATPTNGAIYWWDRSKGTGNRAVALGGDAPPENKAMLVSQRDRHVFALGAFDYYSNAYDPMLIRWCSTEDLNDWVPTSTNTAGDLRLYSGSKIVTGVRSRLESVIFTDVSVHTIPWVGGFSVFGLNPVGENVSILGANCAVPIDHRVMFMAESDFYVYDGVCKVMPCSVRNYVYDNLNVQQSDKIYGGLNREFNEVWWFYPSFTPEAWTQQDFSLGLPFGYSITTGSSVAGDPLFAEVQALAKFEGADAATAYTEVSQNTAVATFNNNAQIDTAQFPPLTGATSSLLLDGTGDDVSFPDIAAYDLAPTVAQDWTIECFIRLNTLLSNPQQMEIMGQYGAFGQRSFSIGLSADVFSTQRMHIRADGSDETFTIINTTLATNTWYHYVMQRNGTNLESGFNGQVQGGASGVLIGAGETSSEPLRIGSVDGLTAADMFDGWIGGVRITTGTARYSLGGGPGAYTVPTAMLESASGAADVGYSYAFNSGGYTEAISTADTNYEHDYFLTNDEPIITPMESEYAVELDVNPLIGAGVGQGGLSFLRTDLTGTGNTDADDAQQWMFVINYDGQTAEIWKKESTGVAAPDNQGSNTVDFATLTGSAMVTGEKYILTVQFDTPTITLWVGSVQAFQFDMSAAELLLFTSGTVALHQAPGAVNDLYRFYNLASGPIGVLTATDFDISPVEVNRYVAFNYEEGTWVTGSMARTAWADRSPLLGKAYATGTDGYLYQHETGTDANGTAMEAFIESYDMEIPSAGEELMHVDQLIPDFLTLEGSVNVYLTGKKYPGDLNRQSKGPYPVIPGTRKISTRMRLRQVAIKVESVGTGDKWRMGHWRGRAGPHGKRG